MLEKHAQCWLNGSALRRRQIRLCAIQLLSTTGTVAWSEAQQRSGVQQQVLSRILRLDPTADTPKDRPTIGYC